MSAPKKKKDKEPEERLKSARKPQSSPQSSIQSTSKISTSSLSSTPVIPIQLSVLQVMSLQNFDGSFQNGVIGLLGLNAQKIKEFASSNSITEDQAISIFVLAYLENKMADKKDEWLMGSMKTQRWLQSGSVQYSSLVSNAASLV